MLAPFHPGSTVVSAQVAELLQNCSLRTNEVTWSFGSNFSVSLLSVAKVLGQKSNCEQDTEMH